LVIVTTKRVSVTEAKRDLPSLLKESQRTDVLVFNERKGTLAAAIVSPMAYGELSRVRAYLDARRISEKTAGRRLRVSDLIRKSRAELEARGR